MRYVVKVQDTSYWLFAVEANSEREAIEAGEALARAREVQIEADGPPSERMDYEGEVRMEEEDGNEDLVVYNANEVIDAVNEALEDDYRLSDLLGPVPPYKEGT